MKAGGKSLLRAGGLGTQAIARLPKRPPWLRLHFLNAFGLQANFELVVLTAGDRDVFRAHLARLDPETRRERFGAIPLDSGFFERYVQDINFVNTLLLAFSPMGSCELRRSCVPCSFPGRRKLNSR